MFTVQKSKTESDRSVTILETVEVPLVVEVAGPAAIDAYVAGDATARAAQEKALLAPYEAAQKAMNAAAVPDSVVRRPARGATSTKE